VLRNAKVLAATLMEGGASLITGGTDNHMMVLDTVKSHGIDGRVAEETLDQIAITTNKQVIPDDPNPPLRPSGVRIGTPAATSRGMKEEEMVKLGGWITRALAEREDEAALSALRGEVEAFCRGFPVPGISS
jgi:glycine hydroxymethyltransferase